MFIAKCVASLSARNAQAQRTGPPRESDIVPASAVASRVRCSARLGDQWAFSSRTIGGPAAGDHSDAK